MPPPLRPWTLKVVSESRVTWATSVPILVFLGLSVLDLGPMYATDRQTDVRQRHCLMPRLWGLRHDKQALQNAQLTKLDCHKGASGDYTETVRNRAVFTSCLKSLTVRSKLRKWAGICRSRQSGQKDPKERGQKLDVQDRGTSSFFPVSWT